MSCGCEDTESEGKFFTTPNTRSISVKTAVDLSCTINRLATIFSPLCSNNEQVYDARCDKCFYEQYNLC